MKVRFGYNHFAVKSMIYKASLKKAMELLTSFNMGDYAALCVT
jgi:hypothetical protein